MVVVRPSGGGPRVRRFHQLENVNTKTFIPREYQVELLDAIREKSLIACFSSIPSQIFLSIMAVKELSHQVRDGPQGTYTLVVVPLRESGDFTQHRQLVEDYTDLRVFCVSSDDIEFPSSFLPQVIVATPMQALRLLHEGKLVLTNANLVILDQCHLVSHEASYWDLVQLINSLSDDKRPRILGFCNTLLDNVHDPQQLCLRIHKLEETFKCPVITASELTTISKFGNHPTENVILHQPYYDVEEEFDEILDTLESAYAIFANENLIQDDMEPSPNLPPPEELPKAYILETYRTFRHLGPWCTRVALHLLLAEISYKEECLESSAILRKNFLFLTHTKLQMVAALSQDLINNADDYANVSSSKLHYLLSILKKFKPPESAIPKQNETVLSHPSLPEQQNADESLESAPRFDESFPQENLLHPLEVTEDSLPDLDAHLNSTKLSPTSSTCATIHSPDKSTLTSFSHDGFSSYQDNLNSSMQTSSETTPIPSIENSFADCGESAPSSPAKKIEAVSKSPSSNVTHSETSPSKTFMVNGILKEQENDFDLSHQDQQPLPKGENQISSENHCSSKEEGEPILSVTSQRPSVPSGPDDSHTLCGLVFVRQRVTAYLLSMWLSEVAKKNQDFAFLRPNFLVNMALPENSNYRQEDVLQKFRSKECNLLIAPYSMLESLDVPKCNLSVLFDAPRNFRTYIHARGKARVVDSHFLLLDNVRNSKQLLASLKDYKCFEQILLEKCEDNELPKEEEVKAENVDHLLPPYQPLNEGPDGAPPAKVTLSTAIGLVNKYCAKLPSDTFTRLTPYWHIEEVDSGYQCSIQLPINSPLKKPVTGQVMPTRHLAKMAAALQTCIELHQGGELDDNLLPTGKEAVKFEEGFLFKEDFSTPANQQDLARPGTKKHRQHYFKQVASDLQDSQPQPGQPCYLYHLKMALTCPIPEEQNTRGRKIDDPAQTSQGFGILTSKSILPICSFPLFTRSGEVTVEVELVKSGLTFTEEELAQLLYFHHFTFSNVLQLEKYPMVRGSANSAECSFYIVPTNKFLDEIKIDWAFVAKISQQKNFQLTKIPKEDRLNFVFDEKKYEDAVVIPWYRNLDRLQFFYVAEICHSLTPHSDFPASGHSTFAQYYLEKYNIEVVNEDQPLLDVDHTSARLNLLTPRYVNRKGVTLPTSSEQTKRAKRENLQQKQILVPELCVIHPFPASLWRKAVCLPCILYRINSLLLAEQMRRLVATEIGIGVVDLPEGFKWPMLDFGWTLADVLTNQSKEEEKNAASSKKKKKAVENISHSLQLPCKPEPLFNEGEQTHLIDEIDPSSQITQSLPTTNDDYIIDHFDPTIHKPPNDADLSVWQNSSLQELGEPTFRVGSPSNFEGTSWDLEWDDEEANVFMLNTSAPGLSYISGPGQVNMAGLSSDLQSYNPDLYDSFDELDYFSDDSDLDSSLPKFNKAISSAPPKMENPYISEWLIDCDAIHKDCYKDKEFKSLLDEADENVSLHPDDPFSKFFPDDNKLKGFDIVCDPLVSIEEAQNSLNNYKIESALNTQAYPFSSLSRSVDPNGNTLNDKLSNTMKESKTPISSSNLPFGELLPDRESIPQNEDDKDMFRIHFDEQPDLSTHIGPSPSLILQALTMSNANDGINLERLETVGDSFLKYAITTYLFCKYPSIHEGKLSFLRSKQISNLNLYRLGRQKGLGNIMVASKFEPSENWLPPCYTVPKGLEESLIEKGGYTTDSCYNIGMFGDLRKMTETQLRKHILESEVPPNSIKIDSNMAASLCTSNLYLPSDSSELLSLSGTGDIHPTLAYSLLKRHSIPDKSVADCVEALIGCYLISCGPRGALLFMSWLGLKVLPSTTDANGKKEYHPLMPPPSPLLTHVPNYEVKLARLLSGYDDFERKIKYTFKDKSYLLQAFTHASYHYNRLTDCYQRLEFLGDAVLDYLITRHLYEDPQKHSPGTLTDLRSALVNNSFFASLAIKYEFYKYFKAISPGLFHVINKFVEIRKNCSTFHELEGYYLEEDECEETEEIEVPKALGDVFESVAGAIYLDSGMSLDAVWRVYYGIMKPEIEYFSTHVPKSPIRELLEMQPQTTHFERAETTLNGKVRVKVNVVEKGVFVGIGRNKRIAKCTAAKRALRFLKKGLLSQS